MHEMNNEVKRWRRVVGTSCSHFCWKCTSTMVPAANRDVPRSVSLDARDIVLVSFWVLLAVVVFFVAHRSQLISSCQSQELRTVMRRRDGPGGSFSRDQGDH